MRQQPKQSFQPRKRRTWKTAAGAVVAIPALALASTGCGTTPVETPAAVATAPKIVKVALLSPSAGTVTSAGRVTVRGTVSPANAMVLVQGRPAAVGNGVFTAMATVHRGRTTIDVIATAGGAAPGSTRVAISRPRKKARPVPTVTVATEVPAASLSGPTTCGDGLAVGPNTTCAFAENVRAAYEQHGPGTVMAYSPVTRQVYAMSCSANATVVCTGGNNASVFIGGGAAPVRTGGTTACGDSLSVGPNTTCAFAVNVRSAYRQHGPGTVVAYSPVTHRTYAMSCSRGALVVCTGGNNASVYFS
jgi:hypothetical protein